MYKSYLPFTYTFYLEKLVSSFLQLITKPQQFPFS